MKNHYSKALAGLSALSILAGCSTAPSNIAQSTQRNLYSHKISTPAISTNKNTYVYNQSVSPALELILDSRTNILGNNFFKREGQTFYTIPNTNRLVESSEIEFPYILVSPRNVGFAFNKNGEAKLSPETPIFIGKGITNFNTVYFECDGTNGIAIDTFLGGKFLGEDGVGNQTLIVQKVPLRIFNLGGIGYALPSLGANISARMPNSATGFYAVRDEQRGASIKDGNAELSLSGQTYTFNPSTWGEYLSDTNRILNAPKMMVPKTLQVMPKEPNKLVPKGFGIMPLSFSPEYISKTNVNEASRQYLQNRNRIIER